MKFKHFLCICLCTLFVGALTGCIKSLGTSADSSDSRETDFIKPTVSSDVSSTFRAVIFGAGVFTGYGDRLYVSDIDYTYTLNPENGQKMNICKKTNCRHNDETCDGYLGSTTILPAKDRIYYFKTVDQKTVLYSCGLNGENKQPILEVWNDVTNALYEAYLVEGHIYCTWHLLDSAQIYDIDLINQTSTVIANIENEDGVFAHILDVVNGTLYYQVDYGDKTLVDKEKEPAVLSFNNLGYAEWYQAYCTGTSLYSVKPEQSPILLKEEVMGSSWSNGCNGCVYYTSKDKQSIYQYDLTTGTEYLVYKGEGPYEIRTHTYDNVLVIRAKEKDNPTAKLFTLNLSDGKLNPVTITTNGQAQGFFNLYRYAVSSDYYFIDYSLCNENQARGQSGFAIVPKKQFKSLPWDLESWIMVPDNQVN